MAAQLSYLAVTTAAEGQGATTKGVSHLDHGFAPDHLQNLAAPPGPIGESQVDDLGIPGKLGQGDSGR